MFKGTTWGTWRMQHPAGKLLETSGTSRVELQLSQLFQSSFERRFLRCLTAFSTALVAGSSSRQTVFVDYDIKKKDGKCQSCQFSQKFFPSFWSVQQLATSWALLPVTSFSLCQQWDWKPRLQPQSPSSNEGTSSIGLDQCHPRWTKEELQSLPAVQQCVNGESRLMLTIATALLREDSPEQERITMTLWLCQDKCFPHHFYGRAGQLCITPSSEFITSGFGFMKFLMPSLPQIQSCSGGYQVANACL